MRGTCGECVCAERESNCERGLCVQWKWDVLVVCSLQTCHMEHVGMHVSCACAVAKQYTTHREYSRAGVRGSLCGGDELRAFFFKGACGIDGRVGCERGAICVDEGKYGGKADKGCVLRLEGGV